MKVLNSIIIISIIYIITYNAAEGETNQYIFNF